MNILWFCTDQQRFDTLGCYDNKVIDTPNIDRLAKMGVKFNRTYCQSPVCAPSRASFLSGRYPRTCGVRENGQDIASTELLLPRILKDYGYTCGLSGKLHISAVNRSTKRLIEPRIDDGYDYFRWSHHPSRISNQSNWPTNEYTIWLNSKGVEYKKEPCPECKHIQYGMPAEYSQTKWCVDCAIEYMESAHKFDLPWLFSVNTFDPHHDFDPPKEYLDKYLKIIDKLPLPNYVDGELENKPFFQKRDHCGAYGNKDWYVYDTMTEKDHKYLTAAYYAMIDLIDKEFGRLLDYLEKSNQLEDTMIIYTSDHGESLGDHGIYLKGAYFYEGDVHVPLIISYPKEIKGNRESNALVELLDLVPTICDYANIKQPEGIQGKSLAPILRGEKNIDEHRSSVYSEYFNSTARDTNYESQFDSMVFDGRYKLVRVHNEQVETQKDCKGELYDLLKDPTETVNQYDNPEYFDIKMKMLELLCDRIAESYDPLPKKIARW